MKKPSYRLLGVSLLGLTLLFAACSPTANPDANPTTSAPADTAPAAPAATENGYPAPQPTATAADTSSGYPAAEPTAPSAGLNAPYPAANGDTYSDPFAYCSAVGTIDAPDARYTGDPVPDVVINGYLQAVGLQDTSEPQEMLQKSTLWRCMDSQVYVCNVGANLPCSSKANTDQTPTQAMNDYCAQNPDSESIPASVTGHETIYSWGCAQGAAKMLEQTGQPDAAGFLSSIWYPVQPAP